MDTSRRRLPSWMLGITAAEKSSVLETGVESKDVDDDTVEDRPRRAAKSKKPQLHTKQCDKEVKTQGRRSLKETSVLLKKCGTKGGKRKGTSSAYGQKQDDELEEKDYPMVEEEFQNQEADGGYKDNDLEEDADEEAFDSRQKAQMNQFGEEVQPHGKEPLAINSWLLGNCETKGSKKQREVSTHGDNQEKENHAMAKGINVLSKRQKSKEQPRHATEESFQSDGDFTVEDMVNIAKEYVKADEDRQNGGSSCSVSESWLPPTASSQKDSGRGPNVPEAETESLVVAELPESLPTEGSTMKYNKTGDPTQDMLNLFLGPLLGKCEKVEKKSDAICERTMSNYESSEPTHHAYARTTMLPVQKNATLLRTMLDCDSREQSQQAFVGAVGPSTKKKVSLKDKVALLLD